MNSSLLDPQKRNIFPRIVAILSMVCAAVLIFPIFIPPEVMAQDFDADRELIMPEALINQMSEEESGLSQPEESESTSRLLILDEIARAYGRKPLHPYFRDEYRVVTDLRRLVKFVDKHKVKGFESVEELVNIGSDLPLERQTAIVSTALAGSVANILSGMANKQLRRWKVRYIQWETERVAFRTRYRDILVAAIYKGVSSDGIQVFFPFAGVHYSYYLKELSQLHRFTYWLRKRMGFGYAIGSAGKIYSGIISPFGKCYLSLSYREDLQQVITSFELRNATCVILRILVENFLSQPQRNIIRSEMLLRL